MNFSSSKDLRAAMRRFRDAAGRGRRAAASTFGTALLYGAAAAAAMALTAPRTEAQTRELGASGELLDGIAAVVDEGVVLKSELQERLALVVNNIRQQQAQQPPEQRMQLPPLAVLEEQVLDQLILKEVQLQRADRLGINVSDQMLNQALSNVAQNLGLSLEQLPAALASENIDYAMYREDSRDDLILDQLEQRDVLSRISITPRELEQCLNRTEASQLNELDYNVSHILIGVSNSADTAAVEEARRRVDEIYERLEAGEDFAQLALAYSDAQTALEGGSLGWRKGSQLPTLFADTVIRMEPGEYSDPIQSGSGFHIVKLNEARGAQRVMEDQLRLRHILITPNEILDDDAVRQRLLGIREQILGGDEFGPIARAVSEDTVSAADGGDLGWIGPDSFVPEFEAKLAELEVGELSEPFQTRFGWHIVEITDKRSYDMTEELKRQQCAQQIRANKAEEERELWLRRLRDQAYVDVRL
ncbi:MAG: peptidylprolyl isomerase [Gammaproteobacteria bacterium]|nr:peptidylprolyl isomerase [Gammaproteobacteria bacterium]